MRAIIKLHSRVPSGMSQAVPSDAIKSRACNAEKKLSNYTDIVFENLITGAAFCLSNFERIKTYEKKCDGKYQNG